MLFYGLYLIGYSFCRLFPRRLCYWFSHRVADFCCWRSRKDQEAVRQNLQAVLGCPPVPDRLVREVFRQFGMYLVDFFRFDKLTPEDIRQGVRLEGMDRMEAACAQGRGVVVLTAHLGNYELGAAVLSLLGLPVEAVVLTHQNPRVDAFFNRQRAKVGVRSIPVQKMGRREFFDEALAALKRRSILGLVGDRDYFDHGITLPLFGRSIQIPGGTAFFALKTNAPIVPAFLLREPDSSYRFVVESPIEVPQGLPRNEAIRKVMEACLSVMERYIRQYPTQWYMFQEFWKPVPAVTL